ncbi:hypothetical protein SDC9_103831 [bioreactor metagenome]|uniref:Uncharacterized protein n=1 Tax=bioreactor metagenome TaxID=1076179 RepID=A0A645B5K1_9ZZZZ
MAPAVSCVMEYGTTPPLLTHPIVGLMPTRLLADDGERTELIVSVPIPTMPKSAAIAAPVPPEEPPGVLVRSYGLSV